MITRLSRKQLIRIIENMPSEQKLRQQGFEISTEQSPYKKATFDGKNLALLKTDPKTNNEYWVDVRLKQKQTNLLNDSNVDPEELLAELKAQQAEVRRAVSRGLTYDFYKKNY